MDKLIVLTECDRGHQMGRPCKSTEDFIKGAMIHEARFKGQGYNATTSKLMRGDKIINTYEHGK